MKKLQKYVSFILCFCMVFSLFVGTNVTLVKATGLQDENLMPEEDLLLTAEGVALTNVSIQMPEGKTIKVWYRFSDGVNWDAAWQDGSTGISIPSSAKNMEILLGEATQNNYTIRLVDNGAGIIAPKGIQSSTDCVDSVPGGKGGTGFWDATFIDGATHNFQIEVEVTGGGGSGGGGPAGGPGDVRFCIRENPQGGRIYYATSTEGPWTQQDDNTTQPATAFDGIGNIYIKYECNPGWQLSYRVEDSDQKSKNRVNYNDTNQILTFDRITNIAQFPYSAANAYEVVVNFMEDESNDANWENQFTKYFNPGLNVVSQYIGSSEGCITYEFLKDDAALAAVLARAEDSPTNATVLDQRKVEEAINPLLDRSKSQSEKYSHAASCGMFGIPAAVDSTSAKFVLMTVGTDLGGNHIGFDVFTNNGAGMFIGDDTKNAQLKYYDYYTGSWKNFSIQDRQWEDYIKQNWWEDESHDWHFTPGLLLDISGIDLTQDALRANLWLDSRKTLSWWLGKYRGEVEAAGDHINDEEWIDNGNFELVSVTSGDGSQVYYSNEEGWRPDPSVPANYVIQLNRAGYDFNGSTELRPGYNGPHGNYTAAQMAEAGRLASGQGKIPQWSKVTIKAIPDPGYQILSAKLCEMELQPNPGTQGEYSFIMTGNAHVSGIFEKTKDVISVDAASGVSEAQIAGADGVTEAGNLALTVKDDAAYDDSKALAVVEGEKLASLDVELDQVIAKAGNLSEAEQAKAKEGTLAVTTDKFWKTTLSELNKPVDISLTLNDISAGDIENLALVRDHNGVCEEIPVQISTEGGQTKATFTSDKFSTYTFVKKTFTDEYQRVTKENAQNFVNRLYNTALGRSSDEEGLNYWSNALVEYKKDAAGLVAGFFLSKEYKDKAVSDEKFIEDLYETVLGRSSDTEGKAYWISVLKKGTSREAVLASFVNSKEFTGICDDYNIPRGTMEPDGTSVCNENVRKFVLRNYSKALGRKGESEGVEYWCHVLNSKKLTPLDIALSFYNSKEFKDKNLSNEEFVESLYESFMGRHSDAEGKAYWLNCMKNGMNKQSVMEAFAKSKEFSNIMSGFGF